MAILFTWFMYLLIVGLNQEDNSADVQFILLRHYRVVRSSPRRGSSVQKDPPHRISAKPVGTALYGSVQK